jgi:hypothetical protein
MYWERAFDQGRRMARFWIAPFLFLFVAGGEARAQSCPPINFFNAPELVPKNERSVLPYYPAACGSFTRVDSGLALPVVFQEIPISKPDSNCFQVVPHHGTRCSPTSGMSSQYGASVSAAGRGKVIAYTGLTLAPPSFQPCSTRMTREGRRDAPGRRRAGQCNADDERDSTLI